MGWGYKTVVVILLRFIYCYNEYVNGEQFLENGEDNQNIKNFGSGNRAEYQAIDTALESNKDYDYEPIDDYDNGSDSSKHT